MIKQINEFIEYINKEIFNHIPKKYLKSIRLEAWDSDNMYINRTKDLLDKLVSNKEY